MHFHAAHTNSYGESVALGPSFATSADAVDRIRSYAHSWRRVGALVGQTRTLTSASVADLSLILGLVNGCTRQTWRTWGCDNRACKPPVKATAQRDLDAAAEGLARATGSVGATYVVEHADGRVETGSWARDDDPEELFTTVGALAYDPCTDSLTRL